MMFSTRASLRRAVALSRPSAMRNFALLVPITKEPRSLPADVQTTPLTDAYYSELQASYTEFNESCKTELQEMNKNIIENIVDRGGNDGWDTTEDRMTKTFEFSSFEQCQAFCNGVSIAANEKDHHPEWKLTNGGTTVEVTLTSHFAGNKVTRLDFELAEAMNEQFERTLSSYKMFPTFNNYEWANLKIGLGLFVLGTVMWRVATGTGYEMRAQRPEAFPVMPTDLVKVTLPRTQTMVDAGLRVDFARANQNKYYAQKSDDGPLPGF